MDFGPLTYLLGYLAGALSTLSPCVLPLLPIVLATALAQHRHGPLALALGLTLAFTAVGLFIATLGSAIGLDAALLRRIAAVLMMGFGLVLVVPALQWRYAVATGTLAGAGGDLLTRLAGSGWRGQFGVGCVLGLVWSPCVGPTLGAASTLAAQGRDLPQVALLMLLFGLGAGTPLLLLGRLSHAAAARWRGRLTALGERGRQVLGAVLIAVGLAILGGADRQLETWVVEHAPDWLTALTTRF